MRSISNLVPEKSNYIITYSFKFCGCDIVKDIIITDCGTLNDVNNKLFKLIKEKKISSNGTILEVKRLKGNKIY